MGPDRRTSGSRLPLLSTRHLRRPSRKEFLQRPRGENGVGCLAGLTEKERGDNFRGVRPLGRTLGTLLALIAHVPLLLRFPGSASLTIEVSAVCQVLLETDSRRRNLICAT